LPQGIVLMFHEIHENDEGYSRELRTGCTTTFLESAVVQLRRARWDIVTLDEAIARLDDCDPSRRFAVLTFDDGYRNTLTRALTILERHRAPFTVYVPTGAVTRDLYSWWLGLRALFQSHDKISISAMDEAFECSGSKSKVAQYVAVKKWIGEDYRRATLLDDTFRSYRVSLRDLNDAYFMTPTELCALALNPLVTIGAHTTTHAALSTLDGCDATRELADNRHYLERLLGCSVPHLAYPFGNPEACGQREFALAAKLGFRSAVTASHAPVFAAHRRNLCQIPRVGVSGTAGHLKYFAADICDLRNALESDYPPSDT
jgi:peptidoglycan/xylan/chitin deacetylase (PgdA/CDA1 family)